MKPRTTSSDIMIVRDAPGRRRDTTDPARPPHDTVVTLALSGSRPVFRPHSCHPASTLGAPTVSPTHTSKSTSSELQQSARPYTTTSLTTDRPGSSTASHGSGTPTPERQMLVPEAGLGGTPSTQVEGW